MRNRDAFHHEPISDSCCCCFFFVFFLLACKPFFSTQLHSTCMNIEQPVQYSLVYHIIKVTT